ncbi:bifunctional DNA primase/polymerase [Rhodococcus sp. ABRD24]|uniref:bifunctional DNA primase/polymerase n=1 Tax=Rhodococcus sp. ABRD24 TaxID=2507582 RepID=UPI0010389940|nr:bifunctional DNA primase/polymerase [Rhodococcus sp. ABRD24]QBJ94749.1 bifunctional DNA primase/polymerase [Rhodococcus sp. ABRD24]
MNDTPQTTLRPPGRIRRSSEVNRPTAPVRDHILEQALAYVRAGLPVLPLRGKAPITSRGVYDASLDEDQLRQWWSRGNWNVGVAVPEGLVVLDVDPRNGGTDAAQLLTLRLGGLPDTLRARTGGGGWHVWLRIQALSGDLRSSLGDGIDVKRFGGYVVMPPSIHPNTGRPYAWHTVAAPATAPATWDRELRKPTSNTRPAKGHLRLATGGDYSASLERLANTTEGGRGNALFAVGASMRDDGQLHAENESRLFEVARHAGLDDAEITKTIESVKRGNGKR